MPEKLLAPQEVTAQPRDNSVIVRWNKVDGADGYIIYFYKADDPENHIKRRYAQGCSKQLMGFVNGTEYLAAVCAFYYEKSTERIGEMSEKVSFVPISDTLKAQDVMCIAVGETGQIKWESRNKVPMAFFRSDNDAVASVGNGGMVHGNSKGTANITVSAEGQRFTTVVHVGRGRNIPDAKAEMLFAGSLMCAVNHQRAAAKHSYDFGDCFNEVRSLFKRADLAVASLDTVCCDSAPYEHEMLRLPNNIPNCNSPSSFVTAAAHAGFDVMVTANDHSVAAGYDGLQQTVRNIKQQGMANLGALGEQVIFRVVRGIKVALIACTMVTNHCSFSDARLEDASVIGSYSRERFRMLAEKAKKSGAEYIVAYLHWGATNSRTVSDAQKAEAQFIADCGADLIAGTHPHMLQEVRYITSADGRKVPCAYSLGNFLSSQCEMADNRDSIIFRAELTRTDKGITTAISCVPCHCFNTTGGVAVRPVCPSFSARSREALRRIRIAAGKRIKPHTAKYRVLLSGSVILDRIFRKSARFKADKTAVLLSQIAAFSGSGIQTAESGAVGLDISKGFADYIKNNAADFVAVDFYAAASLTCYKMGDCLYTGSKPFVESDFYQQNKDKLTQLKPPYAPKLWKPCIKKYAEALLEVFPPERIILFRQCFSEKSVTGRELRLIAPRDGLNRRIAAMEDYFISLVQPAVVDISRSYFNAGSAPSIIEDEYYTDAQNAALRILTEGRSCVDRADLELWYDRVLRYHRSMTDRGFQRWMLNMRCAADMLIAYTCESFCARFRERLLRLKQLGKSELSEVRDFFAGDSGAAEIVAAAELINAVLSGDLDRGYDVYAPAFREDWGIVKLIAKLLSAETEAPVTAESAELVFLLRSKPEQLRKYITSLRNITVDIWGSSLSKEIIDRCGSARVGRYVFGQCPLLANEPLVPVAVPQDDDKFSGNAWRRRMTEEAFSRMGMFKLTQSGSKWLVIDFYDAVSTMSEINGGLFVVDEFLKNTDFYKDIKSQCTPCFLFEKRNMAQCQNALKRFTEDLSYRYGKNIILVKTDIKNRYITLDDRLEDLPEDKFFELKRKFIALCEKYFIEYTGCFVIDTAKYYHAADRHPQGAGNANYEAEFYRISAEHLAYILRGGTERLLCGRDEEYLQLRDLRLERD